jgi:hypothetical protein
MLTRALQDVENKRAEWQYDADSVDATAAVAREEVQQSTQKVEAATLGKDSRFSD